MLGALGVNFLPNAKANLIHSIFGHLQDVELVGHDPGVREQVVNQMLVASRAIHRDTLDGIPVGHLLEVGTECLRRAIL